jgi:hypothetical protein
VTATLPPAPAAQAPDRARWAEERRAAFWLTGFVLFQMACQAALCVERLGAFRPALRLASFLSSIALIAVLAGRRPGRPHPALALAVVILILHGLEFYHPRSNGVFASAASAGYYLAVLAPLFWVARLGVTTRLLQRLLVLFWLFHTLSSLLGVLQVYYPGTFMPTPGSYAPGGTGAGRDAWLEMMSIRLADGRSILRPMGLSDTPGGAGMAGMYATVFGLGFLFNARNPWLKALGLASVGLGLFCVTLSHVRSLLIVTALVMVAYAAALAVRGDLRRLVGATVLIPLLVVVSMSWALSVGGPQLANRLGTLTEARPTDLYYTNRGKFLSETVHELIPRYPLGAGLGRWGMVYAYFGKRSNPGGSSLWAEIQMTGWLYDGGVPMVLLYYGALLLACWVAWRLVFVTSATNLPTWAVVILAYDLGALAMTLNYPIFNGQAGMEFWLLNACLFAAAVQDRRPRSVARPNRWPAPPPRVAPDNPEVV